MSFIRLTSVLALAALATGTTFDVRSFGAKGNGISIDTAAIENAVGKASDAGGGVVLLPAGKYLSGTIKLASNITLRIAEGATLVASTNAADFGPAHLIYAADAENVSIDGRGTIDGNGPAWWEVAGDAWYKPKAKRPSPLIELFNCRRVRIHDVTIVNPPGWTIHPLECDDVDIRGITILADSRGPNIDGIGIDSSRNLRISDSRIENGDDCIVLKTTGRKHRPAKPTENVTVSNCILSTTAEAFKIGTESLGDFRNIAMTNCAIYRRPDAYQNPISGIAIEMVDGAVLDGVVVSNVTMREVDTPIFIRLGNRGNGQPTPVAGVLRNVTISNIVATGGTMSSHITGIEGRPVRDVMLSNIRVVVKGGEKTPRDMMAVPEKTGSYPIGRMFGKLPSYGLFVRHVEGLTVRDMHLQWQEPDVRPAMIFNDVAGLRASGLALSPRHGDQPQIWLHAVSDAALGGTRLPADAVRVTGSSRVVDVNGRSVIP